MNDADFLNHTADILMGLPTVEAVTLGGSRAQGTNRPDSDWDLAIYYRGPFDPASLEAVGWPGEVCAVGAWGGGVYNGGAWLTIDGRAVDVHYRDLDVIEHEMNEAEAGRFRVELLMFHLVGIPTYLVVAEMAINTVLRGQLPRPNYPEALQATAPEAWLGNAELLFGYAASNHAPYGRITQVAGMIAQAASCSAHAVLAARGEWVTNEKSLLSRAGLRTVDDIVAGLSSDPEALAAAVQEAQRLCQEATRSALSERTPAGR